MQHSLQKNVNGLNQNKFHFNIIVSLCRTIVFQIVKSAYNLYYIICITVHLFKNRATIRK